MDAEQHSPVVRIADAGVMGVSPTFVEQMQRKEAATYFPLPQLCFRVIFFKKRNLGFGC